VLRHAPYCMLAGANTEWGSGKRQMVTRKVWRFGHALVTD